ncbi:MAG: type VI secretion system tip protein TssI/VgrG [Polyangiaceae bacterium]
MAAPTRGDAPTFELKIEDAPHPLVVHSLRGRERLSKPFKFEVVALGPPLDAEAIEAGFVGQAAHLRFGGARERWVHGVVRRMEADARAREADDGRFYRLEIVPTLRLLGEKRNSRIFQDQTTVQIVAAITSAAGITLRTSSGSGAKPRAYCVQHQETDLAFVERLLAEDGIFYWFDQPEGEQAREIFVLGDAASACKPLEDVQTFRVAERQGMADRDDRDVSHFRYARRVRPGATLLRGFDFSRPSFDLKSEDGGPSELLEQYHHDFGELDLDGAGRAHIRLEQHRRKLWIGRGESAHPALAPGFGVRIDGAGFVPDGAGMTLIEVEHEGRNPRAHIAAEGAAAHEPVYQNRFACVPASAPFRPRAPKPRTQQVMETATVVGPPGEEIHTDDQGRIRLRFHWDREAKPGLDSSCWVRVMQPWAGAGWGFQFIPRVGMEVMVVFLAGDVDRPMVIGSVYNAEHPPPFALPANKAKSGIRTRSTPRSDGGNELSFDDTAGQESIVLRAQSHLDETVGVDHTTKVGHDRRLVVEGDHASSVKGDSSLTVQGDKNDLVKRNRTLSTGGNASTVVRGNSDERVRGSQSVDVEGAARARYRGGAVVRVDLDAAISTMGGLSVQVGASEGASGVLHAKGSWTVGSDTDIVLTAANSLTLQCGTSTVRIAPDRVDITADAVAIKGRSEVTVEGGDSLVDLGAEARVTSRATRLFGAAASVEVSSNAYMQGAQIKLGAREGDPPSASPEDPAPPTRTLSLKLSDAGFQSLANRPYELTVDGVRYTGNTDGGGNVSESIPEAATKAHLLVWEGEPPTGKHHTWDLLLKSAPPASSPEGARARLANLGYEVGGSDPSDPTTKRAIVGFQEDHDLEPSGELDAATTAKLMEVHGH